MIETERQWNRIGQTHHHGINIPLFSIRTEKSSGIGEFNDLKTLIDWCRQIGFSVIQMLPLNDPGLDTSPYNAISSCALNPLHLSLRDLPETNQDDPLLQELKELNETPRIVYTKVRELKMHFLWNLYQKIGPSFICSSEYRAFRENHPWLKTYSLYKTLKGKNEWLTWTNWDTTLQSVTDDLIEELSETYREEVHFHQFIQFFCFEQFHAVKEYANERGIFLKGDIPILISPDSADVWANRHIFDLNLSAGVPPDQINPLGQNWKFPIYRWDRIEAEGFAWWKQRLKTAELLYDIYRIDHIVGFFRIWAIPPGQPGLEGAFLPRRKKYWGEQGRKILTMMCRSSSMLPIGEDLGTIPPITRKVMHNLGIAGTKVLRWELDRWKGYRDPKGFDPFSMTTVSTHDVSPLKLWWKTHPSEAKKYAKWKGWEKKDELAFNQHVEILHDSHSSKSLFHLNLLQEYLTLFRELHWPNLQQERINFAGTICDLNWTTRYRKSLEEITEHQQLTKIMHSLAEK